MRLNHAISCLTAVLISLGARAMNRSPCATARSTTFFHVAAGTWSTGRKRLFFMVPAFVLARMTAAHQLFVSDALDVRDGTAPACDAHTANAITAPHVAAVARSRITAPLSRADWVGGSTGRSARRGSRPGWRRRARP